MSAQRSCRTDPSTSIHHLPITSPDWRVASARQSDPSGGGWARLGNCKFLDAIVHGVADVQETKAIKRESVRHVELSRPRSRPADSAKIRPVVAELLDAVVG